jgi:hypothetical protein
MVRSVSCDSRARGGVPKSPRRIWDSIRPHKNSQPQIFLSRFFLARQPYRGACCFFPDTGICLTTTKQDGGRNLVGYRCVRRQD